MRQFGLLLFVKPHNIFWDSHNFGWDSVKVGQTLNIAQIGISVCVNNADALKANSRDFFSFSLFLQIGLYCLISNKNNNNNVYWCAELSVSDSGER